MTASVRRVCDMTNLTGVETDRLLADLRHSWANVEKCIEAIIDGKGWLSKGYGTFVEFWDGEMADFPLATDALKIHVVFAMLNDGTPELEIATTVKGITPPTVREIARKRGEGVPPDVMTTTVRRHERNLPGERRRVSFDLDPKELEDMERVFNALGLDLKAEAEKGLRARYNAAISRLRVSV